MTSYEEYEPEPPRGWSPFAVASIATLVLLLGLGGALFGIYVSDQNKLAAEVSTPESPSTSGPIAPSVTATSTPPASTSPSPSPTVGPTGSAGPTSPAATFPVPSLTGLDFRVAWGKLRDLKLGWDMKFEGAAGDLTVSSTDPAAGTPITKGMTVHVHVRGPAPLVAMPNVVGLPCDQAADALTNAGSLVADYPAGHNGVVKSQDPLATDPPKLRWGGNGTKATITCG